MPKFANGIFFEFPKGSSPEFVVGRISVKKADFIKQMNEVEGDYVKIDVVRVKGNPNKTYTTINEYKPEKEQSDGGVDLNDI